jgi:hypothetical protein
MARRHGDHEAINAPRQQPLKLLCNQSMVAGGTIAGKSVFGKSVEEVSIRKTVGRGRNARTVTFRRLQMKALADLTPEQRALVEGIESGIDATIRPPPDAARRIGVARNYWSFLMRPAIKQEALTIDGGLGCLSNESGR